MNCTCGRIKVGSTVTESRNWNPDCTEHGTSSVWYNSPEQVERRKNQNKRLRELQIRARLARSCPDHEGSHCPVCQAIFEQEIL